MQIRHTYSSEDALVDISSTNGDIVLSGATGEITFTISAEVMEILSGKYVYDLELFQGSNPEVVKCPVRGEINVRPEVTR